MHVSDLALIFQIDNIRSIKKTNHMKFISNAYSGPAISYLFYLKIFEYWECANGIDHQRKTL